MPKPLVALKRYVRRGSSDCNGIRESNLFVVLGMQQQRRPPSLTQQLDAGEDLDPPLGNPLKATLEIELRGQ